jgi:hypothetical protein
MADAIEEENVADNEKICQLEDSLDEMESKVATIMASLTESEKASDEALQARKILENRGNKQIHNTVKFLKTAILWMQKWPSYRGGRLIQTREDIKNT